MRWSSTFLPILICLITAHSIDAQTRRARIRARPIQQQPEIDEESEYEDEDDAQHPAQFYSSDSRNNGGQRVVLVASNDDYNGVYGQPTTSAPRGGGGIGYNNQIGRSSTQAPRTKDPGTKPPPVQTIRNYSKVNDDGSFTFGYEAADGSFKEETRGTDCVVRGKYGYVDPDGNKREFTYVSGNPCDPDHPDETEEEKSEEDSNEPENVPQNYPRRPVPSAARPPLPRPTQPTTQRPTTVFQNTYSNSAYQIDNDDEEEEEPDTIQLLQQPRIRQQKPIQEEVTIRQRPRLTVVNTTPTPNYNTPTKQSHPVSITPRPTYRVPQKSLQTQPPATTYRPAVQFVTQKPASISYSPSTTASHLSVEPITKNAYVSSRKPIDFAVEFQKFQQEHNAIMQQSTTPRISSTIKSYKAPPSQGPRPESPTSNPIYESQLVFDPSTGQYDSALYQQLPQSDGDFSLNHRIQPYQPQFNSPFNQPSLVNLEQLQQQHHQSSPQPIFHRQAAPSPRPALQFPAHFSQQIYQKDQENHQVLNSQQLYAQQQELQQQQLHQDRIESAKRQQAHRFQLQPQPIRQEFNQGNPQQPAGFYYVAPQQSSGHIDAFLRGHNIDFN